MRQLRILALSTLLVVAPAAFAATQGNVQAGKKVAEQVCSACHGLNGISSMNNVPNLAGQKETYLVAQLKGFRHGTIKNATMDSMASSIASKDVNNVAAYYSSLKSCQK